MRFGNASAVRATAQKQESTINRGGLLFQLHQNALTIFVVLRKHFFQGSENDLCPLSLMALSVQLRDLRLLARKPGRTFGDVPFGFL
ncbi:hypothetical protein [Bradyrhizobium lablabi]|uniref:hypothetical protein n=1 Tax=Bradyrhizobium lablabi TaxID=722472 RepID=UPI001BA8844C|nr:hypothetical protein [Bradyrhizobium lablabi]MBR0696756.1 hypothetical protein [Bradyrhizobium lablabi]